MEDIERLHKELMEHRDLKYRKFVLGLHPFIRKSRVIGVRVPMLRNMAKEIEKGDENFREEFLGALPHKYMEEDYIHGFLIEEIKDIDESIAGLDKYLPYIDNWATCDSLHPKILAKYPRQNDKKIFQWIKWDNPFAQRFAILQLMRNFLGENFHKSYLEKVAEIKSDHYYVNMMIAWYFSEAIITQYDSTIVYLERKKLSPFIQNKTIQKVRDSKRVSDKIKKYVKTLKI